jgi:hypothetical protein
LTELLRIKLKNLMLLLRTVIHKDLVIQTQALIMTSLTQTSVEVFFQLQQTAKKMRSWQTFYLLPLQISSRPSY